MIFRCQTGIALIIAEPFLLLQNCCVLNKNAQCYKEMDSLITLMSLGGFCVLLTQWQDIEKEETIIYQIKKHAHQKKPTQKNFFYYKIFLFILIPLVLLFDLPWPLRNHGNFKITAYNAYGLRQSSLGRQSAWQTVTPLLYLFLSTFTPTIY